MAEITLEQCALLVAGWLRALEKIGSGSQELAAEDLPPGYSLAPEIYLNRQNGLSREACAFLESSIDAKRSYYADEAAIAEHQRLALANQVASGVLKPASANRKARELSEKTACAEEEIRQCDLMLRQLRGEEQTPVPRMPLFHYAISWQQFRESMDLSAADKPRAEKDKTKSTLLSRYQRTVQFIRNMQRSDRIAMAAALCVSLIILIAGYMYIYSWGRLHVQVGEVENQRVKVTFINSFGETVALHAPYDGKGLPDETVRQFGVVAEAVDAKGNVAALPSLETLWTFQDQPAHLYGPVLISPLSSAELWFHVPDAINAETNHTIRLVLYQSPHRRYSRKNILLPAGA